MKERAAHASFCNRTLTFKECRRDSDSCWAAVSAVHNYDVKSFRLSEDMMKADVSWLKDKVRPHYPWCKSVTPVNVQVCLYTAGFPCTPFSMLHHMSKMLKDKNAKQLWKTLQNIKEINPAATCP